MQTLASSTGSMTHRSLRMLAVGSAFLLTTAVGCATTQTVSCQPSEKSAATESIYFGSNKPGGTVTTMEWAKFVNDHVTPAFPEGLTSWAGSGQWRMADGKIEREVSYILQLTHDATEDKERAIRSIMERYKKDFHQEAVLRVRSHACLSF